MSSSPPASSPPDAQQNIDIQTAVLHLLVSKFQPGALRTFEDYIETCQHATNIVSFLDFQALSDVDQNLVVDILEAAVTNLNASVSATICECWNAVFRLFCAVERQLGEYSHYKLYLRVAAIEVLMTEPPSYLEQPLALTSDSMHALSATQALLEEQDSFPNLNISRTPSPCLSSSPLSSLTSLSSLRNFTPSPSEMVLDSANAHNESPLTASSPTKASHALDKYPSPADTDSLLMPLAAPDTETDTGPPSTNSLCLTLFPTENVLADDFASLDNSQSPAASDDDLEKKVWSRKPSGVAMSRRKRAVSTREDKENLDMDIAL